MFSEKVCLEFSAMNKKNKKSVQTGDSLLEFVVLTFETNEFFTGVLLELVDAASASSSWSIIVIRFFNSFPKSPIETKYMLINTRKHHNKGECNEKWLGNFLDFYLPLTCCRSKLH